MSTPTSRPNLRIQTVNLTTKPKSPCSTPPPSRKDLVIWKVTWKFGLHVRAEPRVDADIVSELKFEERVQEQRTDGDWIKHSKGWTLSVNVRTKEVLMRKVDPDDLELLHLIFKFHGVTNEHKRLLSRARDVHAWQQKVSDARKTFCTAAAVLGSHSKASSEAVRTVQNFFLLETSVGTEEKKHFDDLQANVIDPLEKLGVDAKAVERQFKPIAKRRKACEKLQDQITFLPEDASEEKREALKKRYKESQTSYTLLRDQLSSTISSVLNKLDGFLLHDLSALSKKQAEFSAAVSSLLSDGDWQSADRLTKVAESEAAKIRRIEHARREAEKKAMEEELAREAEERAATEAKAPIPLYYFNTARAEENARKAQAAVDFAKKRELAKKRAAKERAAKAAEDGNAEEEEEKEKGQEKEAEAGGGAQEGGEKSASLVEKEAVTGEKTVKQAGEAT